MAHRLRTTALNFPIYPSLLSCKLMASIFINCCYIHLCMNISICIPKDINTDCLVYIMLLVCVFFGTDHLILDHQVVLFAREDYSKEHFSFLSFLF